MMIKSLAKVALAGAVAIPLSLTSGVVVGQTVDSQSVGKMPPDPLPRIHPRSKIIPGVRLSNNDQQILGVVQRVVKHGDEEFALVTVGEFTKKVPGSVIAVPVKAMWIDGQHIKYDIAWDRYRALPSYDGKKPKWVDEKK